MTTSLRETILLQQEAAGLPIGDIIFGVLPDDRKVLVWGAELLAAIIETGQTQDVMMVCIRVDGMDEARALTDRYWLACGDEGGTA